MKILSFLVINDDGDFLNLILISINQSVEPIDESLASHK